MYKKIIYWLIILTNLLLLTGCGSEQINFSGKTMGTSYSIKYVSAPTTPPLESLQRDIEQKLQLINDQMSTYREDSELSRFNQSRQINTAFPVSAATAKVVREAIRINGITEGALDVTVGSVVNLWGFGPEGRPDKVPTEAELEKRRAWIGIDKLAVEQKQDALIKTIPELYVDLSGIAKGYGVDVIADYLEANNIHHYMVDIGGEIRTRGNNGKDQPWRIAIEKPNAGGGSSAQEIIEPGIMSVATSGDYRNYFEEKGVRYSHTIDPSTGRPINHRLVSVTVLDPSCMTADGLSTGLDVLGPQRGMELANLLNIPVFMIIKTDNGFEARYSTAFEPYLRKKH